MFDTIFKFCIIHTIKCQTTVSTHTHSINYTNSTPLTKKTLQIIDIFTLNKLKTNT